MKLNETKRNETNQKKNQNKKKKNKKKKKSKQKRKTNVKSIENLNYKQKKNKQRSNLILYYDHRNISKHFENISQTRSWYDPGYKSTDPADPACFPVLKYFETI